MLTYKFNILIHIFLSLNWRKRFNRGTPECKRHFRISIHFLQLFSEHWSENYQALVDFKHLRNGYCILSFIHSKTHSHVECPLDINQLLSGRFQVKLATNPAKERQNAEIGKDEMEMNVGFEIHATKLDLQIFMMEFNTRFTPRESLLIRSNDQNTDFELKNQERCMEMKREKKKTVRHVIYRIT